MLASTLYSVREGQLRFHGAGSLVGRDMAQRRAEAADGDDGDLSSDMCKRGEYERQRPREQQEMQVSVRDASALIAVLHGGRVFAVDDVHVNGGGGCDRRHARIVARVLGRCVADA